MLKFTAKRIFKKILPKSAKILHLKTSKIEQLQRYNPTHIQYEWWGQVRDINLNSQKIDAICQYSVVDLRGEMVEKTAVIISGFPYHAVHNVKYWISHHESLQKDTYKSAIETVMGYLIRFVAPIAVFVFFVIPWIQDRLGEMGRNWNESYEISQMCQNTEDLAKLQLCISKGKGYPREIYHLFCLQQGGDGSVIDDNTINARYMCVRDLKIIFNGYIIQ